MDRSFKGRNLDAKVLKSFHDAVFNCHPALSKKPGDTHVFIRLGDAASFLIKAMFLQEVQNPLGSVRPTAMLPQISHLFHVVLR